MKIYLDSSAIVKLVKQEAESQALRAYLVGHPDDLRVTSELARVEVVRALSAGGPAAVAHARRQLDRMDTIALDRELLDSAASLQPGSNLRSLDAIHLISAQMIGSELRAVLTYDQRMAEAAATLGLSVEAPA